MATKKAKKRKNTKARKNVKSSTKKSPKKTNTSVKKINKTGTKSTKEIVKESKDTKSIVKEDVKKEPKSYEKLQKELLEERYDINEVSTVLEILKTKGERCGLVGLKYDKELKTYTEAIRISREEYDREIRNKGDVLPW